MEHERIRFRSMNVVQLWRRLAKITDREKLGRFSTVAREYARSAYSDGARQSYIELAEAAQHKSVMFLRGMRNNDWSTVLQQWRRDGRDRHRENLYPNVTVEVQGRPERRQVQVIPLVEQRVSSTRPFDGATRLTDELMDAAEEVFREAYEFEKSLKEMQKGGRIERPTEEPKEKIRGIRLDIIRKRKEVK